MIRLLPILMLPLCIQTASAADGAASSSKVVATGGCTLPPGWADVAVRKPRFVVFGEIHGTQEAPELVGDIACALAADGKNVLVAVEHDVSFDPAYQAAWRQPPSKFGAALLDAGWKGGEDGKSSVAMLTMLKRLHELAWRGRPIHIAAFDGVRDDAQRLKFGGLPGQGAREAAQADNIRIAADERPYDLVLVLTGNLHARERPFERAGTAIDPMAMHLAKVDRTVTLDARYSGGSAWTCELKPGVRPERGKPLPKDAVECAVHGLAQQADLGRAPFLSLSGSQGGDDPYDGFFWLGTLHGSPPAVPSQQAGG